MSNNDPYAFDKDGNAWKAFKYRERLSIQEFAEILGNCDNDNCCSDWEEYSRRVNPWIKVLSEAVIEEKVSDDYGTLAPKEAVQSNSLDLYEDIPF